MQQLPALVTPSNPELVQSTLKLMKSMIVYALFECDDGCRSRGMCVHFSFLLGCRRVPDGLICPRCQETRTERPYAAQRICLKHNKRSLSQFTPNLSEDVLASEAQVERANEIFSRSWSCDWEGVSRKAGKNHRTVATDNVKDSSGHVSHVENSSDDADIAMPFIDEHEHSDEVVPKRVRTSVEADLSDHKNAIDKENANAAVKAHGGSCDDHIGTAE